jgi:transposase-like protein
MVRVAVGKPPTERIAIANSETSLLKNARFNPEFVTLCLDLYFSGLSLRKIARTVANHFNIDIYFSTIYRWIQKYVPMVSEYVNPLAPNYQPHGILTSCLLR